jgi:glycosyltransferase involved in cell wall biosynthesis
MKNKVIAIISVLKPVDDTRNYEKIATSLGNTNKYDINIIGFKSKNIPDSPAITVHPEFDFDRKSSKRLLASLKIWQKLIKLKPDLIIVTCAELLGVMCLYKILFGCRIIYDIQENYFRNILYSGAYPVALRYPAAVLVRLIEYVTSPFVDSFLLAERVYAQQLHFIRKKYIVVENKAILPKGLKKSLKTHGQPLRFLYCGTISRHFGAMEAIGFFKKLLELIPGIQLVITGHAPDKHFFSEILMEIDGIPSIQLIGNGDLVPHNDLLKEMTETDFVLMPYHHDSSVKGRIPTKLYECLAMEIPVIISPNKGWSQLIIDNNAGIIYDFKSTPDITISNEILSRTFFGKNKTNYYLWTSYEKDFVAHIQAVLHD